MREHVADEEPTHPFLAFRCNFTAKDGHVCERSLQEGWITGCSHLFCSEHATEHFKHQDKCPVCRVGPVRLVKMDLSRSSVKHRGKRTLIGLTPPEIVQAADAALSFWVEQKINDYQRHGTQLLETKDRQKTLEQAINQNLREAESACEGLQSEQQRLEQLIEDANEDNRKADDNHHRWKRELAEAEGKRRTLQRQMGSGGPCGIGGPAAALRGQTDEHGTFRKGVLRGPDASHHAADFPAERPREASAGARSSGGGWFSDFCGPSHPRSRGSTAARFGETDFPWPTSSSRASDRGQKLISPRQGSNGVDGRRGEGALPSRKRAAFGGLTPGIFGSGHYAKRRIIT